MAMARLAKRGAMWFSTRRRVIVRGDSYWYEAIDNGREKSCSSWLVLGCHEEG